MNKPLAGLSNLSRLAPASHFRAIADVYEPLKSYSPSNLLAWVRNVGAYWLRPKHKFLSYVTPETGIYQISNQTTMSLAADWATGTNESQMVANQISAFAPDYTVHLGDIYYVGKDCEVQENFLGVRSSTYDPVVFPRGKQQTFSLLGNHDMYTNGNAYFDLLLPALNQKASYFCLQNDFWRIVALDTGYNSTGVEFWPFKPSAKLQTEQLTWLASLNLKGDKRGLIFLSHHQPFSDFEKAYPDTWKQLTPFLNRPILWFWGHEHRMAIYQPYQGIWGRCIGNGGMPVELKKASNTVPLFFTDKRSYPNTENLKVGFNGFVNLVFIQNELNISYRDLDNNVVYAEQLNPENLS